MTAVTVNQNIAECLRNINGIGGSTIRNICTGSDAYVPWGSLDWALFGIGFALFIGFLAVIVGLSILMIQDIFP